MLNTCHFFLEYTKNKISAKTRTYKRVEGLVFLFACCLLILLCISSCNFTGYRNNDPLIGKWIEKAQIACDTGLEVAGAIPIEELDIRRDGTFSVTWRPFETYRDYWGEYKYDHQHTAIELIVTGGNYIPQGIDTNGTFTVDDSEKLILTDIWLGLPLDQQGSMNCGYVFERMPS